MSADDKREQVTEFFGRHAEAYAISPSHRAGPDLARLIELVDPQPHERALDVATAAGHTALALAPRLAEVVGLDLTPEMEAQFRREAAERRVQNAAFRLGDVMALPFRDAEFDLVVSRRAAHHFPDAAQAVREMARVLRPGGRLGIVDMTVPDDPAVARLVNDLEIARDGSHVQAYSAAEWRAMVEGAGLGLIAAEVQEDLIEWARWLYPVKPDGPEARAASAVLERAGALAERVVVDGRFLKRRLILLARRPD